MRNIPFPLPQPSPSTPPNHNQYSKQCSEDSEEEINTLLDLLTNLNEKKPPYPCLQKKVLHERLRAICSNPLQTL